MNAPLPCFPEAVTLNPTQAVLMGHTATKPMLVLPSINGARAVTINECARQLFGVLANNGALFVRGGVVHEVRPGERGLVLHGVKHEALAGLVQRYVDLYAWRTPKDEPLLKPLASMPLDTARTILATPEARECLPPIATICALPGLVAVGGELKTLSPGYNRAGGGTLVTGSTIVPLVPVAEAVESLSELLRDFLFATPGDRARALAGLVTPALRMAGLIPGHVPILVIEADASQTGKGLYVSIQTGIYGEQPGVVTQRTGGVGSFDESLSQRLIEGRPFIQLDNIRGRLDSAMLEAILTPSGAFNARTPGSHEVPCDPTRHLFCMTSNGASSTVDLANRASIIRLRKQVKGFEWHQWPVDGGGVLAYVQHRQAYLLGCVHAIVRAWWERGRPSAPDRGSHSFREWAGIAGWIVSTLFGTCELLDGHEQVQQRVAEPGLGWMRDVAVAVGRRIASPGQLWSASRLVELCQEEGITIPGAAPDSDEKAQAKTVGTIMRRLFEKAEQNKLEVDAILVTRGKFTDDKGREGNAYMFTPMAAR